MISCPEINSYSEVMGKTGGGLRRQSRRHGAVLSIRRAVVAPLLPLVAVLLLAEKLVDERFVLVGLVVRGVLQGL